MFSGVTEYFAGIGRAMRVRSGQSHAQAERLRAYGELRRVDQAVPTLPALWRWRGPALWMHASIP